MSKTKTEIPRAWVVGKRPRGKLGSLRVRVGCGICESGPLEECHSDRHEEALALARKYSWHSVWLLLAFRRRIEDVIPPGVHPWRKDGAGDLSM